MKKGKRSQNSNRHTASTTRSGKVFNGKQIEEQMEISNISSSLMNEIDLNGFPDDCSSFFEYIRPKQFENFNRGKKSILGSSGCFFASFISIFWYLILFRANYKVETSLGDQGGNTYINMLNETHQNFIIASIGALGATIGEGISNRIAIDDNLLLPVFTASFLSFIL